MGKSFYDIIWLWNSQRQEWENCIVWNGDQGLCQLYNRLRRGQSESHKVGEIEESVKYQRI